MGVVRYIKMALVSFAVFFLMFTVIGLLFPSRIDSVNAVIVNNSRSIVLKEMQPAASWIKWYPFFQPNTGAVFQQQTADSIFFINDKKKLLLHGIKHDSNTVSFYLTHDRGRVTQQQVMALDIPNDSNQVQLVWKETEKLKWYPWERFRGLVLEKAKKEYLESMLKNFKAHLDTIRSDQ
jgi:hypothetical protein